MQKVNGSLIHTAVVCLQMEGGRVVSHTPLRVTVYIRTRLIHMTHPAAQTAQRRPAGGANLVSGDHADHELEEAAGHSLTPAPLASAGPFTYNSHYWTGLRYLEATVGVMRSSAGHAE